MWISDLRDAWCDWRRNGRKVVRDESRRPGVHRRTSPEWVGGGRVRSQNPLVAMNPGISNGRSEGRVGRWMCEGQIEGVTTGVSV